MRQIWLGLIVFALVAPWLGTAASAAETPGPTVAPEDHVLGKPDAPITIIEYASLTCPHCAEFDKDTLPKLKEAWIDTGKAKLVFRGFPLNSLDVRAQALARCAPPDKYFAFIDTLYQNQRSWALSDSAKALNSLENIGRLGGISPEQFKSCANDPKLLESIQAQGFAAGQDYQVELDADLLHQRHQDESNGAQPYEVFDKVLASAQPTN